MSTKGTRDYRPKVHFTPDKMWMNDPNGMVYIEGNYHFFYQYYPEDTKWGPMHWGHAVSSDLLHWEHLDTALYPDELGYIFSGSCVYDTTNCSGYGENGKAPLLAVYTSHGQDGLEQQSIAYSRDYVHFEKAYCNPVIKNPGVPDFRDPKVFYNPQKNCYSLVLAVGEKLEFYESANLKLWKKSGEFIPQGNCALGICECPDCFPIVYNDVVKWVLIISFITTVSDPREKLHKTAYFVGDFDGNTFKSEEGWDTPAWLDYGPDNYAAVSFQNIKEPTIMGWASNWGYANQVPTGEYCGQATIPRVLNLVNTKDGLRLTQTPIGIEHAKASAYKIGPKARLLTDSFGLIVTGKGCGQLTFSNARGQQILITIGEEEITADRTSGDKKDFHEFYGMPENCIFTTKRQDIEKVEMEILFDVSLMEIFADAGLSAITMSVYPDVAYDTLLVEGDLHISMYNLI